MNRVQFLKNSYMVCKYIILLTCSKIKGTMYRLEDSLTLSERESDDVHLLFSFMPFRLRKCQSQDDGFCLNFRSV